MQQAGSLSGSTVDSGLVVCGPVSHACGKYAKVHKGHGDTAERASSTYVTRYPRPARLNTGKEMDESSQRRGAKIRPDSICMGYHLWVWVRVHMLTTVSISFSATSPAKPSCPRLSTPWHSRPLTFPALCTRQSLRRFSGAMPPPRSS